jgi:acetyltransferase
MQTVQSQFKPERATDILRRHTGNPLDAMMSPRRTAIFGATESEGSVGRALIHNVSSGGFSGAIYPINPKRATIFGMKAYPRIADVPERVDLAVIATPASTVPGLITDCAALGIPAAIIISAGFKETGPAGVELEKQILQVARHSKMRILGPNCLGLMRPHFGLNATFAADMGRPGSVAFLSQSGALCTAILDWSFRENVGFSAFASLGSMLDVGWGDLIYYLGEDPHTKSIVMYMESIGDARSFLSAAREVALTKPIIVIKVGRTDEAAKAAASHTGTLTGSDDVLHAAFRRAGVLRVDTIAELFDMAEVLAKQPRPRGPRLAIVTNAGGPAVLATDMLISSGGKLAELSPKTFETLNGFLPGPWSHNDPIDILGDADPQRYGKAIEVTAKDPANDGLLVILTPQAMTDAAGTAEEVKKYTKLDGKPILASWMGVDKVEKAEDILNSANIPTFKYPDRAARAFSYMWRYSYNLRALYETPAMAASSANVDTRRERAATIIQAARNGERTILTEYESKKILEAYAIPTVETHVAHTAETAVKHAEKIGYPVVLKLYSEIITHKTDVGGVKLNLRNATAVTKAFNEIESAVARATNTQHAIRSTPDASRITHHASKPFLGVTVQPMIQLEGYELILGSSLDPQFGPVLLFGTGGQLVEVFKDRSLGLPPLNATLARRVIERTQIYHALKGVRGRKPVDLAALDQLLVRFSELVIEQPWIAEIDINPLIASPEGLIALDARVLVHGKDVQESQLPKLAIRPYPAQYIQKWKLPNGTPLTIRPIRPEDEPLMVKFHETLSEQSVYYRYFSALKLPQRIEHERLTRICFNDYDHEIAMVVNHHNPKTHSDEILGVGRLSKVHGTNDAEFALLISDKWQNESIGKKLLTLLVKIGQDEKLKRIVGYILPENRAMQHICKKVGFTLRYDADQEHWEAVRELD